MFGQGWAIAPGANAAGIVTSNGLRVRVGALTSFTIAEDFDNETFLDRDRSAGTWLGGTANFAQIGGDGRHGTFAPELGVSLGVIAGKRTFQFATNNIMGYPDERHLPRYVIRFPGNAELFLNSIFWLSKMEPMISISPSAMQAPRIRDMMSMRSPATSLSWQRKWRA